MRRAGRLRGHLPAGPVQAAAWSVSAVAGAALVAALMLAPNGTGAIRLVSSMARIARTISKDATVGPAPSVTATSFDGDPAVGALFMYSNGQLGNHFCTGTVVDSRPKDLVMTAAHCVSNIQLQHTPIAFVPQWHAGRQPYGVWTVTQIVVDGAWQKHNNPNHDFAFLVVQQNGNSNKIQDVTGGDELGIGWRQKVWVHVVGYPDNRNKPIICQNRTRVPRFPRPYTALDKTQMEFDCGGYTTGTSGGPFLARYNYKTREGIEIGLIGGFEDGGLLASVSYSPRFGSAVRSLYHTAENDG